MRKVREVTSVTSLTVGSHRLWVYHRLRSTKAAEYQADWVGWSRGGGGIGRQTLSSG